MLINNRGKTKYILFMKRLFVCLITLMVFTLGNAITIDEKIVDFEQFETDVVVNVTANDSVALKLDQKISLENLETVDSLEMRKPIVNLNKYNKDIELNNIVNSDLNRQNTIRDYCSTRDSIYKNLSIIESLTKMKLLNISLTKADRKHDRQLGF